MKNACNIPITVKHRLGIDNLDNDDYLILESGSVRKIINNQIALNGTSTTNGLPNDEGDQIILEGTDSSSTDENDFLLEETDIETLFALTKVGTKVKIIDKKIIITHLGKDVFIEVSDYDKTLESIPNDEFNFQSKNKYLQDIIEYTKKYNLSIDWSLIKKEVKNSSGIPILIITRNSN